MKQREYIVVILPYFVTRLEHLYVAYQQRVSARSILRDPKEGAMQFPLRPYFTYSLSFNNFLENSNAHFPRTSHYSTSSLPLFPFPFSEITKHFTHQQIVKMKTLRKVNFNASRIIMQELLYNKIIVCCMDYYVDKHVEVVMQRLLTLRTLYIFLLLLLFMFY